MTASGTNVSTSREQLGSDWGILARQFDANHPTIGFTTDSVGGRLLSTTFTHIHNHNPCCAPSSYTVQMEFKNANGTWSDFGSSFVANGASSGSTQTVLSAAEIILEPNTNYALRWTTTNNGSNFTSVTSSDFFAIANLSIGFKKNQSISITQATNTPAGGTLDIAASVTSGLSLTWNSTTTGVCTVSGTASGATATLLTAGVCTLTAAQAGDAVWSAATTETMSFTVLPAATTTTTTTTTTIAAPATTTTPTATTTSTLPESTTTSSAAEPIVTTTQNIGSAIPTTLAIPTVKAGFPQSSSSSNRTRTPPMSTTTTTSAVLPLVQSSIPAATTTRPALTTSTSVSAATPGSGGTGEVSVIPPRPNVLSATADVGRFFTLEITSSAATPRITSGRAVGRATGLRPGASVTVTLHSDPVLLGTVNADANGVASFDFGLPPTVDEGAHVVIVDSVTDSNEVISAVAAFDVTRGGLIENIVPTAELVAVSVDQNMVDRSVASSLPIYDSSRHVARTVALISSAVVVASAVASKTGTSGTAGGTGGSLPTTPNGRSSPMGRRLARRRDREDEEVSVNEADDAQMGDHADERDESSEGSMSSTDVNLLDDLESELEGRGDQGVTWRLPGHALPDRIVRALARTFAPRSKIAMRVVQDGQWFRSVFGVLDVGLWIAGAVLGVIAAFNTGGMVLVPGTVILVAIVCLSFLDALAGLCVWVSFAVAAVVTGHVTSVLDVRTLVGLGIVFWALPSVASAIRPMRRLPNESRFFGFDRLGDYAISPLFVSYASASMLLSLNGLAGLETVTTRTATVVQGFVFGGMLIRLVAEDIARVHFPARLETTRVEQVVEITTMARCLTVVISSALYLMCAAPFFGLGWRTWTVLTITIAVPILQIVQDSLPNLPAVHKWFPRGILRSVAMIFVAAWLGRTVLALATSPQHAQSLSVLLFIPALVVGIVDVFARDGHEWPASLFTKFSGALLWIVSALALMGILTP